MTFISTTATIFNEKVKFWMKSWVVSKIMGWWVIECNISHKVDREYPFSEHFFNPRPSSYNILENHKNDNILEVVLWRFSANYRKKWENCEKMVEKARGRGDWRPHILKRSSGTSRFLLVFVVPISQSTTY